MSNLIYKKMSQVMAEIGAIGKDQKNVQQGFKFRGVDQFVNSLYPALVKHGVFMSPRCMGATQDIREVTRSNGKAGVDKHVNILMEYDFYAEDGSKVTIGPVPGEAVDSGDKATNKALSASLKYALIQTFSIPTEDMAEGDKETIELGSQKKNTLVGEAKVNQVLSQISNPATQKSDLDKALGTPPAPEKKSGFGSRFAKKTEAAVAGTNSSDTAKKEVY